MTPQADEGEATDEVGRIRKRIAEIVEGHFNTGKGHLFLAQLGSKLGQDRVTLEKLTRMKLSQFVRSHLSYEIGTTGEHKNVLYFVAHGKSAEAPDTPLPRYLPKFWAAFAVPLTDAHERHINLETLKFGPDVGDLQADGQDVRPIDAKYISPRDASGSASDTAARILAWLHEQHLAGDRFVDTRKRHRDMDTLLDVLLKALDIEQLKRISLPLDIVKALAERRR
jgi:hypothetical protein